LASKSNESDLLQRNVKLKRWKDDEILPKRCQVMLRKTDDGARYIITQGLENFERKRGALMVVQPMCVCHQTYLFLKSCLGKQVRFSIEFLRCM